MQTGLLGDLIEILHNSHAGYVVMEFDEEVIIVADKMNASIMLNAVEEEQK